MAQFFISFMKDGFYSSNCLLIPPLRYCLFIPHFFTYLCAVYP